MSLSKLSIFYKITVIFFGSVSLILAIANMSKQTFDWEFIFFLAFALLLTPKMSIMLPRAKFALSYSDSVIFLSFIFYGGNAAILLAAVETFANCVYLKNTGVKFGKLMIAFNVCAAALATTLTYIVWTAFSGFSVVDFKTGTTENLVSTLCFLAVTQFFTSSVLVALLSSILTGESPWKIWKTDCFASSIPQIAGAILAGIIYGLITYADFLTTAIALFVFGVIYVNYRQTIKNINDSIEQVEQIEREKAEIAELKAEAAKSHAAELKLLLSKEEKISEALLSSKNALEHAAFHDFLTDLPNRTYLVERLNLLLEIGIEISHKYYVLFLDLKRFKNINDSLGHNIGDRVLRLVGKRLMRLLRKEDTVARLGGDEFAIILNDLSSIDEARKIAEQIYEKLSSPFRINGNTIFCDLNIGIAPFDVEQRTPEDVLRDADIAMHYAKATNTGIGVFDKNLRANYLEKITLEADLRFALERGELLMHYQPLISLKDGELIGFEALLRWQHPEKGFVSPAEFIPIAEDSGLIVPITKWILRETCSQIAEWQKLAASYDRLIVSVNISGKHLTDEKLIGDVQKALVAANLSPASLKLEITETTAMENAEQSINIFNELKRLGVQLSIDDFGTGYSSLSYLHRLPFDSLKIDRSFVSEVGEQGENSEVLQTIVSLAKNLKMRIIAEGIETTSQLAVLQNFGCDYGQGYLMSKPLPQDAIEQLLYQKKVWLPLPKSDSSDASTVGKLHEANSTVFH